MQDIPPEEEWTLRDRMTYGRDGGQDSSSDEVFDPNDDDEFEDFKPEPEPDLPWWAPLRHLIPYIPYLPITPLGMNLESNTDINDLDLNFLLTESSWIPGWHDHETPVPQYSPIRGRGILDGPGPLGPKNDPGYNDIEPFDWEFTPKYLDAYHLPLLKYYADEYMKKFLGKDQPHRPFLTSP